MTITQTQYDAVFLLKSLKESSEGIQKILIESLNLRPKFSAKAGRSDNFSCLKIDQIL